MPGAAVAHIHVRDPRTGLASSDVALYREVVERVRGARCDILINLTTGPGSRFIPSDDDPRVGGPGTTMRKPLDRVRARRRALAGHLQPRRRAR